MLVEVELFSCYVFWLVEFLVVDKIVFVNLMYNYFFLVEFK